MLISILILLLLERSLGKLKSGNILSDVGCLTKREFIFWGLERNTCNLLILPQKSPSVGMTKLLEIMASYTAMFVRAHVNIEMCKV